ncbi:hypothetical protein WL1483_2965 [Aeromonas schubertii]|uniref:Uncharacterized protein n=1 Tax=Aeromonas schubertii TaxID=652 RepID=A0A0S2SL39_9GAMM|nr:hypothetical protein WL1483_2965 [Aeromonas schubertii]
MPKVLPSQSNAPPAIATMGSDHFRFIPVVPYEEKRRERGSYSLIESDTIAFDPVITGLIFK